MPSGNEINIEIDKLTNSIENMVTGDSFATDVSLLTPGDLQHIKKKNGWLFNWKKELSFNKNGVYKLTITGNSNVVQGLISLIVENNYVYINLVESAPFNRGKGKIYMGVPGNLVALACRLSFEKGFEGFVSFHSKTKLMEHYEKTLGAFHFGGHLMIINTAAAEKLVAIYFKI